MSGADLLGMLGDQADRDGHDEDKRRAAALGELELGPATVEFTVLGTPAPAGSKQAFVRGGRAIITDASKRSRPWKSRVSAAAQDAMNGRSPLEGPLYLRLTFGVKRPLKHFKRNGELGAEGLRSRFPAVRPDAIKLARAIEDALTGIVYKDDAQIVLEAISKHYANAEGVIIEARELPHTPLPADERADA